MTSKNLKRRWPQTWVIPLRGKPFQKPHQADFPQWSEWDPRSIPKSITVQGTRTTTGRTIRTHLWDRRKSPDAQTHHVPCFWFLNRATVLFARTKDGAVGGGETAGSGASLGDTPTISIIAHSLPGVLRIEIYIRPQRDTKAIPKCRSDVKCLSQNSTHHKNMFGWTTMLVKNSNGVWQRVSGPS